MICNCSLAGTKFCENCNANKEMTSDTINFKVLNFKSEPAIMFHVKDDTILTISDDGKFTFSDAVKENNPEEIAKQFIKIVEENTATKAKKLQEIINPNNYRDTHYKKFADESTRDLVKARLFDEICELYK